MHARRLAGIAFLSVVVAAGLALAWDIAVDPAMGRAAATAARHWEAVVAAALAAGPGMGAALWLHRRFAAHHADVERALIESERRFRDLVDLLPEVVFETDARGRLVYLNRQARTITGYDDDDLAAGLTAIDMIVPEERPRARENIAAVMAGHDLGHNEYSALRKDGTTFPITVHSRAIVRDGRLAGLHGTVLDISERHAVEHALRTAIEEAEVASRAKSQFLAAVSHELRTPLNAIIGFSDMVRNGMHGPIGNPRYLEYVADIHESGQHLLELINDILDLSKIEAGKDELSRRAVAIAENAQSAFILVRQRAAAGDVALALDVEPGLPALDADPLRLKQVFVNLLTNAIKFTGRGGTVTLAARHGAGGGIEIAVSDTGIGIAPEDIPKALSQFGQVKRDPALAQEGTGLGLPLTKAIVERHGGTLALDSTPGVGTTVTLRFPPACLAAPPPLAAVAKAG